MKKLAIIVPYRDREKHLKAFLSHMIGFLENRKESFRYEIIVVEQNDKELFNRGALLNAGAIVAEKKKCDEFCFHDIDLLPEEGTKYLAGLGEGPVQLASSITTLDGREEELPFDYFGGVTRVSRDDFRLVNGYSNKYRGWGFEDADFLHRCKLKKLLTSELRVVTPKSSGISLNFEGGDGFIFRSVPEEIREVKANERQLVFFADFLPGYARKAVGYEDMKVISLCTESTDISISFDRYDCCRFTSWDDKFEQVNIITPKVPRVHTRCVGVLDFKTNRAFFYRNGIRIGSKTLRDTRDFYFNPRSISIGQSNNKGLGKRDLFVGNILETGFLVTRRREEDFFLEMSIGGNDWKLQLDKQDFLESYNIDTLVSRAGSTTTTTIQGGTVESIKVPIITERGQFRCLAHKDSKFDQPEVRVNQDRFYRVMRGEIEVGKEGLSDIEQKYDISFENREDLCDRLTWVKVTKK